MNPTEVLSGMGTQTYGGRFATVGTRAVFLAGSDETATREVLARKKRLGNTSQITLAKYPRVVFAVSVTLQKVLTWLPKPRSMALIKIRDSCLAVDDLTRSQELGQRLLAAGVQGLLFPSVVGTGRNLIVYPENCGPSSLTLHNADQMKDRIAEIAKLAKP